jgi:holliday junction DNA helicase RuvA
MIDYIIGVLVSKTPVQAVVELQMGMAFQLHIPISTYEYLPETGASCKLFTHLHFTQDDLRLFGFSSQDERELFLQLTRISGVGPKIALSIISTLPITTFVKAIEREETGLLTKIPGIGLKSAQRLVIELKGKLHHLLEHSAPQGMPEKESVFAEVESALQSLGFNAREIQRELALLTDAAQEQNAELMIKEIIRKLYLRSK